ncbi:glutathione S-transferase N-terminal domain-containing protein, partial [Mesorhizobium sp. M8A.F.Ca.ET.208.01.1.1]|uniref:glutathione S-transferase N-terminal domain-containing protein n=1 Tax=Mesorhizobium sp. M8A.F.Ca.ET.208.01.1.1 TaxID=2563969 RepID=UPI001FE0103F
LEEKGVDYELAPVDIFAADGIPAWYLERHPFGRIPAFEHDGFRLFETGAIARYVDEALLVDAGLRMALTRTQSASEEWNSVLLSAGSDVAFSQKYQDYTA